MAKRIPKDKVEEIKKMEIMIREHLFIADSIELKKRFYINNLLKELGYPQDKNFNINLDNGKIREVEKNEKENS